MQEGETAAKLVDSLDWISRIVFRADEYTKMFSHQQVSARQILQRLHDDLVELFAQALEFLFRTKLFFQKSSIRKNFTI